MTDYKADIHPLCYTLAGTTSGIVCRVVGQPLDVLKIRFQLQDYDKYGRLKYTGVLSASCKIIHKEGLSALWKGHIPAQVLSVIYGIVKFNSYEFARDYLYKSFPMHSKRLDFKTAADFFCGGISGVAATFACQPVDVVRTRLVSQEKRIYCGIVDASRLMFKENGFRTFYKGLVPSLCMIYPAVGFHFAFYGFFKYTWLCVSEWTHSKISLLLCGAGSGVCSKLMLLPFDMLKKRLQVVGFHADSIYYEGMYDCFSKLVEKQGIVALYRGASPSLLKAAVVTSISFFMYELTSDYCYKNNIFKSFT